MSARDYITTPVLSAHYRMLESLPVRTHVRPAPRGQGGEAPRATRGSNADAQHRRALILQLLNEGTLRRHVTRELRQRFNITISRVAVQKHIRVLIAEGRVKLGDRTDRYGKGKR